MGEEEDGKLERGEEGCKSWSTVCVKSCEKKVVFGLRSSLSLSLSLSASLSLSLPLSLSLSASLPLCLSLSSLKTRELATLSSRWYFRREYYLSEVNQILRKNPICWSSSRVNRDPNNPNLFFLDENQKTKKGYSTNRVNPSFWHTLQQYIL